VATLLFTVPVGKTCVVRDIECFMNTVGAWVVNIYAGSTGAIIAQLSGTGAGWKQWTGRVALPAGETISCNAGTTPFTLIGTGYLLT